MSARAKVNRQSRKLLFIALFFLISIAVSGVAFPYGGLLNPEPSCAFADWILAAETDQPVGNCPAGNSTDVIRLFEDIKLSRPLPQIQSAITIHGNGHSIDGGGQFRLFDVKGGKLRISDLTLTRGKAHDGGVIKASAGARVYLSHSTIEDSSANFGGAIWSNMSEITISVTRLTGNEAKYEGGAIFAVASKIRMKASTIIGNSAASGGGATFVRSDVVINRSGFTGNRAIKNGGGFESRRSVIDISDIKIVSNSAQMRGAGALLFLGETTMTHVTMSNNSSRHNQGVLYMEEGGLQLRNSIIANEATLDCNVSGSIEQNIGNLIQDGSCDPMLSGDPMFRSVNGSPTYIVLESYSPAVDAADPDYCTPADLRGFTKPVGEACDIGAFEVWPAPNSPASAAPANR